MSSNQELEVELNRNIDWDEAIDYVKKKAKEDPTVKKYQVLKWKPQTEGQARKNMIVYLKNVAGFKMDYLKGMSYDDIRPIFEAKFNTNVAFLQKTREEIEEEESRALKRINETLAEKAAKRQKLNEEVEELKRHLQIVPNEDDGVYTEATPLARKVPVVDYQIIELNNKPYYKIIRADDTHQLYVSFLSLLRNFDREDLEALWSLVKERFSTTKPKNFSDDFLLVTVTLGAMFEKPDIHAQIWKTQRNVHGPAKVKGWKLLESCGVQIIIFTSTQLILLVERRYPLTRFTLDQMLNAVRLEVEEESEVSLELLRLWNLGCTRNENMQFYEFGYRGGSFENTYKCYSASYMDKPQIENGDKIIMPPSALDRLATLHIDYPMLFELRNESTDRVSHCGVLEFVAEEGMICMPYWMMKNLLLEEGDFLRVKNVTLPKGTYVKLQPHTSDFLNISNPKA
nr:ubiquitin fusion degradation protein 1 homolog [Tanacetum cinerariifolium]